MILNLTGVKRMSVAAAAMLCLCSGAAVAQNAPRAQPPGNAAPGNAAPGNAAPAPDQGPQSRPSNTAPAPESPAPAPAPEPGKEPIVYVLMKTSKGDIAIELNAEKAPLSVANFLGYVDRKYYDGLIFHRVMDGFMIQGGGFNTDMVQKATDPPIKNEWRNGLKNKRGTIAMARLGGNADSATSQFFINVVDNDGLDRPQPDGAAYAVFGKVVAGMKTVDAIRVVKTSNRGQHGNVPVEPIVIESVTRITADDAKKLTEAEKIAAPAKGS